jgi:GNAT superfamily N-acetyltransferase
MADPRDFVVTDTLRNGLPVTIRHLRADDRERMRAAVGKLAPETIYTRLFSHRATLTEAGLDRIMRTDPAGEVMLVVTTGGDGEENIIAGGRFVASSTGRSARTAEVAFVVEEDYRGLGIAGRILRYLAAIARGMGIAAFEADVLTENKSMLAVFARCGLPMAKRFEGGTLHVTLSLADGAQ